MSALSTVESLIATQQQAAQDALDAAIDFGGQAQTAAASVTSLAPVPEVDEVDVVVPLPASYDPASEFLSTYNGAFTDFTAEFHKLFQEYLDEFFPEVDGCVTALTDAWICDTLTNGGTSIPAAIENQIYDRARAAEDELLQKSIADATDEWASRGFSIPPGILAQMVDRARVAGNNKVSTIAREIAIKQIELEIQNIRFAVEQGINMRVQAAAAAANYIRAWFLGPQTAVEKAKALTEARFRFFQTSSAYYSAIIGAADLKFRSQVYNSEKVDKDNTNFVNLITGNATARVNAAVGSAEAMGKAAAAALGALNTLGNVGHVTTTQS